MKGKSPGRDQSRKNGDDKFWGGRRLWAVRDRGLKREKENESRIEDDHMSAQYLSKEGS